MKRFFAVLVSIGALALFACGSDTVTGPNNTKTSVSQPGNSGGGSNGGQNTVDPTPEPTPAPTPTPTPDPSPTPTPEPDPALSCSCHNDGRKGPPNSGTNFTASWDSTVPTDLRASWTVPRKCGATRTWSGVTSGSWSFLVQDSPCGSSASVSFSASNGTSCSAACS